MKIATKIAISRAPIPSLALSPSTIEDSRLSSRCHCRNSAVTVFTLTREFARAQLPATTHPWPSRRRDPLP
ncbi:hypothetical protein TIFTF001_041303 [Ficus carica]|uniref:Uncharacterized protein n=1 Tax=Ficus carica TaxID=3494 RepID=A0AA87Z5U0_FICCA|nr:hypothetical protein TIFTF001_041303 [Ficus carica]